MSDTTDTPAPRQVVSAEIVSMDTLCRSCGYNIRGLSTDGRCPECADVITLSVQGDLLRYANPAWVRRLLLAVRVQLWILAFLAVTIFYWIPARFGAFSGMPTLTIVMQVMWVALNGFSLLGLWLITTPDPRTAASEHRLSVRSAGRWFSLATVLQVTWTASGYVGFNLSILIATLTYYVLQVGETCSGVFSLWYQRRLSQRGTDRKLRSWITWLLVVSVSCHVMFIFSGLTGTIYWAFPTFFDNAETRYGEWGAILAWLPWGLHTLFEILGSLFWFALLALGFVVYIRFRRMLLVELAAGHVPLPPVEST